MQSHISLLCLTGKCYISLFQRHVLCYFLSVHNHLTIFVNIHRDGDICSYIYLDTGLLLKTKGRKEIYSSKPEPKYPSAANSNILGVAKSNTPQRCTSCSAFNPCVLQKRPQVNKYVIIVAIENAKLKLLKVLSSYNNALCDSSKLFYNN